MAPFMLWPLGDQPEAYAFQPWQLLTYGFMHGGVMHLLFNMLTLFFFGRLMEQFFAARLGSLGFLLFYMGGLVVSILPTYLKNRSNARYRSLGASGAVSAVLFAFVLLAPWARIYVFVIPMPAIIYALLYTAYSIYMDKRGQDNVNHSAHLWGAAYGVAFTLLLEPRVLTLFLYALAHPGAGS